MSLLACHERSTAGFGDLMYRHFPLELKLYIVTIAKPVIQKCLYVCCAPVAQGESIIFYC